MITSCWYSSASSSVTGHIVFIAARSTYRLPRVHFFFKCLAYRLAEHLLAASPAAAIIWSLPQSAPGGLTPAKDSPHTASQISKLADWRVFFKDNGALMIRKNLKRIGLPNPQSPSYLLRYDNASQSSILRTIPVAFTIFPPFPVIIKFMIFIKTVLLVFVYNGFLFIDEDFDNSSAQDFALRCKVRKNA